MVHQSDVSEDLLDRYKFFQNISMKFGVWTWLLWTNQRLKKIESKIYWLHLMFFLRFVRVKTMKTKYAKDSLQAFKKKRFLDKTLLKNFGLIKEQNMGKLIKNLQ